MCSMQCTVLQIQISLRLFISDGLLFYNFKWLPYYKSIAPCNRMHSRHCALSLVSVIGFHDETTVYKCFTTLSVKIYNIWEFSHSWSPDSNQFSNSSSPKLLVACIYWKSVYFGVLTPAFNSLSLWQCVSFSAVMEDLGISLQCYKGIRRRSRPHGGARSACIFCQPKRTSKREGARRDSNT